MTELIEPHPFVDSYGAQRVPSVYGFNAYATPDDAKKNASRTVRLGTRVFVWCLSDGTYDWTVSEHPELPWHPAELVDTARTSR